MKTMKTAFNSTLNQNKAFHADLMANLALGVQKAGWPAFGGKKRDRIADFEDFCERQEITNENSEKVMQNLGIEPFCYSLIMFFCMLVFIACQNIFTLTTFILLAILTIATLLHNIYFIKIIENKKYFSFLEFIICKKV
jgi:hypothetical protein